MKGLTPQRALIFRITHIANVPWILDHGIQCRNSKHLDPNYREIGSPDLIAKRTRRLVNIPPGGTLSDYIPFYFTPCSPMLYNIKTGYGGLPKTPMTEIAILVTSLHELTKIGKPFVFSDRHAYLAHASLYSDLAELSKLDWKLFQSRDFKRDPNDPARFERYQAEALIHGSLPSSALTGIACYNAQQAAILSSEAAARDLPLKIVVKPEWYP